MLYCQIQIHANKWDVVLLYSQIIYIQLYTEIYSNMMTRFNERTNTLLYKNIPLSLYSRKGYEMVDVGYVWEVSWRRRETATYWPQVPLYYTSIFSSFCWAAQPGSWGPKPSVRSGFSLQHLIPNRNCNSNSNCNCNSNCNWNSNWTRTE